MSNARERLAFIRKQSELHVWEEGAPYIDSDNLMWLIDHAEQLHHEIDFLKKRLKDTELQKSQAELRAGVFREERNDYQGDLLLLEGAIDRIQRIAGDPLHRFFAGNRAMKEIRQTAEAALREVDKWTTNS